MMPVPHTLLKVKQPAPGVLPSIPLFTRRKGAPRLHGGASGL